MSRQDYHQDQKIQNLMSMFNFNHDEAKDILISSDYVIEVAIQRVLNRQKLLPPGLTKRGKDTETIQTGQRGVGKIENLNFEGLKKAKLKKETDAYMKCQLEKMEKQKVKSHYRKTYIIKKDSKIKKKALSYKKKGNSSPNQKDDSEYCGFLTSFQEFLGRPPQLNFKSQLNDVFEQFWDTRKIIAIHVINLSEYVKLPKTNSPQDIQRSLINNILRDTYLNVRIMDVFKNEFINYGLSPKQFPFHTYPHMREFVNADEDKFCIILLRYNETINSMVKAVKLSLFQLINNKEIEGFKRKIIGIKKDIGRVIDTEICPSIHHNPLSQEAKIKLDEDRKIRQDQQDQYKQIMEKKRNQSYQSAKKKRLARLQKGEQSDSDIQMMKQKALQSINEAILKQRAEKRQKAPIYILEDLVDPITIKLRFPNGKQKTIHLPKEQTIQYIFEYIKNLQDNDLGFQNDMLRNFDLTQPLEGLSYQHKYKEKIADIFPDSSGQFLIIKEL